MNRTGNSERNYVSYVRERNLIIYNLHESGFTYASIARGLGRSVSRARERAANGRSMSIHRSTRGDLSPLIEQYFRELYSMNYGRALRKLAAMAQSIAETP